MTKNIQQNNKTNMTYVTYESYRTNMTYFVLFVLLCSFFITPQKIAHAGTLSRPPTNLGLVGYWPMDEGVGAQVGDASGNRNPGTITGATWTDGKHGKGLSFNGTNSLITTSLVLSTSSPFTFAAWVKFVTDGTTDAKIIFSQDSTGTDDISLIYDGSVFSYESETDAHSVDGATGFAPASLGNNWHHIVVVEKYTTAADDNDYYIDGIKMVSGGNTGAGNPANTTLAIGNRGAANNAWSGSLDDVRIYNRALTATEISKLYSSGAVKLTKVSNSGLVGYWPMDEGRGNKVGDSSGKGNTGTITGATWTNGERGKALSFGGTGYTSIPDNGSLNILSTVSISFWMKGSTVANTVLLEKSTNNTHYHFQTTNEGMTTGGDHIFFGIYSTGQGRVSTASVVADGKWHFITGTFDTNTNNLKIYVDGILDKTNSNATPEPITNSSNLLIGSRSGTAGFPGVIDDVRVFSRVLSAAEVLALYKQNSTTLGTSYENRLTNGLVGFWTMNGKDYNSASTTAEVLDKSGQGNNGNNVGAVPAIGKLGQALRFDGAANVVSIPYNPLIRAQRPMSVSAWIKRDAINENDYILWNRNSGGGWWFVITTANKLGFTFGSVLDTLSTGTITDTTSWHHVLVTVDAGGNVIFYIDGQPAGTATIGAPSVVVGSLHMGARTTTDGVIDGYSDSIIDEVRIYNRALSADEVKQLYKMGQ